MDYKNIQNQTVDFSNLDLRQQKKLPRKKMKSEKKPVLKNNSSLTVNNHQSNITGDLIPQQLIEHFGDVSCFQKQVMNNNCCDVMNDINSLDISRSDTGRAIDIDWSGLETFDIL